MQLNLSHITYTYPGTIDPVLEDVTLTFSQGWTGIVGANGSGKSTLAHLAARKLNPDKGFVSPQFSSAYCQQETECVPDRGMDFVSDYSKPALKLKSLLEIDDGWIWRFDTLSHGERKRLQIGTALWQDSEVLVVDEPTNHLDKATKEVLLAALQSFKGIGIIISHDRQLLDSLVTQCVFLHNRTALVRPGSYTQGLEQTSLERISQERERKEAKQDLARLQLEKVQRSEMADKAKGRRSARKVNKKDHDAKAKLRLAVFTGQDGKRGKLSTQMDARLDQASKRVEESTVEKTYSGNIWMHAHPSHRKVLLRQEATHIPFEEPATQTTPENSNAARFLAVPDLIVGNTNHIGITGVNGSGKSTLIRQFIKSIDAGIKTVYIPQEVSAEEGRRIINQTNKLSPEHKGLLFSIVAQLNSLPRAMLQGDQTSPGELRKLMLAYGLTSDPDLIIMDEPTNHLDILSIEAMERVLHDCPCALLLVSHDEPFIEATTTIRWHLEQDETANSILTVRL